MTHNSRTVKVPPLIPSSPSSAWLFAQAILGKPISDPNAAARHALEEREQLMRLAPSSSRHALELHKLEIAEAEARRSRESLIWAAGISIEAEVKLRHLLSEEAEAQVARQRWQQYYEDYSQALIEWNPQQRRKAKGTSGGGQFAPEEGEGALATKGGSGGAAKGAGQIALNPSDPSHWYLPSDAKGEWLGEKGNSKFRLKKPVDVNGKLVHEIEFTKGVPVLDKFTLRGETAAIILTGDHDTDLRHAEQAWRRLNPGKDLPTNATFHHDLLHVTEQTVTIDGRRTKVLVGKMPLVPKEVNRAVFHEGSASVAKKYYQGLGVDVRSVARLAKEEVRLVGKSSSIVGRALGKIKPGKIAKGILPLVGRNVVRLVPLGLTGLAIVEFSENAQAHGIAGAVARATPVLGDLISAYDVGTELAKQMRDEADAAAASNQRELNEPSRTAWEQADKQTIAAFNELAPLISVTNPPRSEDGAGRVDPNDIAAALHEYREAMQDANYRRNVHVKGFDFDAAAAQNKRQLRIRLERASQRRGPQMRGPNA